MSAKKWIFIGCGGCLGVLVLLILVAGGGCYFFLNKMGKFTARIDEVTRRVKEMNETYPFTPPDNGVMDPARFDDYLSIRETANQAGVDHFSWLFDMARGDQQTERPSGLRMAMKFASLPQSFIDATETELDAMDEKEMSPNEFIFYTQSTASEIISWLDEDDDALKSKAQDYLKRMTEMQERIREQEKKNPHSNINAGVFERDEFVAEMKTHINGAHPNRDLILTNFERINSMELGAFVDAWSNTLPDINSGMNMHNQPAPFPPDSPKPDASQSASPEDVSPAAADSF
ncbi:MAG: hypothetical protein GC154_09175 [bacterium]|nr:hypothetical protein [bacterium]